MNNASFMHDLMFTDSMFINGIAVVVNDTSKCKTGKETYAKFVN